MKKVIKKTIRRNADGVRVEGDVHADIAVNTEGGTTSVSSRSTVRSESGSRRRRKEVHDDE